LPNALADDRVRSPPGPAFAGPGAPDNIQQE